MRYAKYIIIAGVILLAFGTGFFIFRNQNKDEAAIIEPAKNEQINIPSVLSESDEQEVPTTEPPHPVSYPAMFRKEFNGRDLSLGNILATTNTYTRYYITYKSGELTISGIMNIPHGDGPFPALVLNHGHIDTDIYTNGRGLRREQDYFARNGYIVLHTDYRNHAQSDKDSRDTLAVRLAYAEDAINAAHALKNSTMTNIDKENIGMFGHSMGGGVTLGALVTDPELIDAAVLYAPVSGDMRKSYERWIARESSNVDAIVAAYGSPEHSPTFWDNISSETFYERITAPVRIFHGTNDESVPLDWSESTVQKLKDFAVDAELTVYEGAPHEFTLHWSGFMQSSREFFDMYLKQ